MIASWLQHPLARGRDIDSPETTNLRRQIIRGKPFLRRLYEDWYKCMVAWLPSIPGRVLEIGSGAGFLAEYVPELLTSDVFYLPGLSFVMDARRIPLASRSLRAIMMTNVLHHIPDVRGFFAEAARCVRGGGAIIMIEPWNTPWSAWIYSYLHHEPFSPEAKEWEFPPSGPLSGANGALPWILFERDRERFAAEFPSWSLESVIPQMPFRYLLSGGVSYRSFVPDVCYAVVRSLENRLGPSGAMFAGIVLRRTLK
jgi:SAM-dependent methyltransferase